MPPPKHASASKRKVTSPTSDEEHASKKSRIEQCEETETGQPTNKILPVSINISPCIDNCLRLAAWNIAGWGASQKKGFKNYIEAEDPDVLVLTEIKINDPPADLALTKRFPHSYWSFSAKKSYSGTAVLSKIKPLRVTYELPGHPDPASIKGRLITLEFPNTYLISTYVVNAGAELKTLDAKNEWNMHFTKYIRDLEKKKPVIWTGDLNVAPTELDLANPRKNWNKTAGYTEAETTAFRNILTPPDEKEPRFVDVWRKFHPKVRHYTYFSYRFNCRVKGIGWRLDMFVASNQLLDRIKLCDIRSEIYGASDHCPVVMEIEGEL